MDLRKGDSYVSCIKIRGIPIIPPLMTEDVRTEMRYYKHLALAVEERLKNLETYVDSESDQRLATLTRNSLSTTEESSNYEEDSENLDKTSKVQAILEPSIEPSSRNIEKGTEIVDDSEIVPEPPPTVDSLSGEDPSNRDETLPIESASFDPQTSSTDINQYLNDSGKSDAFVSTLENSPELRKPEVPKTLDIVPITLSAAVENSTKNCSQDSPYVSNNNPELASTNVQSDSATSAESEGATPKLVRQGSYVLENPSPVLLAHLQEEKITNGDYVPSSSSSTVSNKSSKRKEWNICQAKSEWELQRRDENYPLTNSSRTPQSSRLRRNSFSNDNQTRTNRYGTQTKIGDKRSNNGRQIARSADCIQSMLYRETTIKNTKSSSIAMINGHGESSRSNVTSSWKSTRSVSILSLANKLGGSLGSLSTPSARSSKRTVSQKQTSSGRSSKSFDSGSALKNDTFRGSTQKLLSAVTSEKLVNVFKEIQNTHERQMTELVARQQREQRNMQKEFEKQQNLLLAQIEQTFPGICLPKLAEKIHSPSPSPIHLGEEAKKNRDKKDDLVPLLKKNNINGSHRPEDNKIIICPLDDIYPREKSIVASSERTNHGILPKKIVNEPPSPPIGLYSTSVLNGERKNYGVSRQLFPLESKTRRVPLLNNSVYEEKHIKAATIINAYARGYLVRRMMETERIIALKTTYAEALHCMLKLHVDAPLALPELNFHQRLQLQCDAASMNIVELFAQESAKRMEIIRQDRQIKRARQERPNSARSCYSFATQRTLARKRLKEMGYFQTPIGSRPTTVRSRCQTWTSSAREKRSPSVINQGIKRSTSAGAVRKPWR